MCTRDSDLTGLEHEAQVWLDKGARPKSHAWLLVPVGMSESSTIRLGLWWICDRLGSIDNLPAGHIIACLGMVWLHLKMPCGLIGSNVGSLSYLKNSGWCISVEHT